MRSAQATTVVPLIRTVDIKCPLCNRVQSMSRASLTTWFPVAPFCCEVMRQADTPEWNLLLDQALESVLYNGGY